MQPPLTDAAPAANFTDTLANLNIVWVFAIIAGLTVLRLALIYMPSVSARSFAEILESGMIAVALVFLVIRPFVLQAFFIPSPSMEPTLMGNNGSGDHILVNKFAYRLHPPQHDDVVVFLAPPSSGMSNDPEFIKRMIGLPGDRLQVVGGKITVGGRTFHHLDVRNDLAQAGEFGPDAVSIYPADQADHHVKFLANGVMADHKLITKERLAEILTGMKSAPVTVQPGYTIRNGQTLDQPFIAEDPDYDMQIYNGVPLKYVPDGQQYMLNGEAITPSEYMKDKATPVGALRPHQYMMMGDNRNDSNDGTNWGPLDSWRIVGKAQVIFWPPSRIGLIH